MFGAKGLDDEHHSRDSREKGTLPFSWRSTTLILPNRYSILLHLRFHKSDVGVAIKHRRPHKTTSDCVLITIQSSLYPHLGHQKAQDWGLCNVTTQPLHFRTTLFLNIPILQARL